MTDLETKTQAEQERNRIIDAIKAAGVSEHRMQMLDTIITNVAWMKIKLDDTRSVIKTAQIVISYDNGGGQKGIRENPLFKGYESLWKSYMAGMNRILDCMPADAECLIEPSEESPRTVLDMIRNRR